MMRLSEKVFLFCAVSACALSAYAQQHYIVAPQCLLDRTTQTFNKIQSSGEFSLIATDDQGLDQLIIAKGNHKILCGGFVNVTDAWAKYNSHVTVKNSADNFLQKYLPVPTKAHLKSKTDYKIQYNKQVTALIAQMNPDLLLQDLTTLTQFKDRYANSKNGVAAATWFVEQVKSMVTTYNRTDVTIRTIPTSRYLQPSVVVKIGTSTEPGVVIGGHIDTLSANWGTMPGADDDGSGAITTLETARVLLASGLKFKKPIYIVWYSAEEEGLIGSQHVVAAFKKEHIPVDQVIQFDMTGYAHQNNLTMWLIDDHVNSDLNNFLEILVKTYVKRPVQRTRCGYACSDHASWTAAGVPAVMPFEASFNNDNPNIHSENDTIDKLSMTHINDYAKLGLAFAVELAEPV